MEPLIMPRTVNGPLQPVGRALCLHRPGHQMPLSSKIKAFLTLKWDIFISRDINVMHTHHLFFLTKTCLKLYGNMAFINNPSGLSFDNAIGLLVWNVLAASTCFVETVGCCWIMQVMGWALNPPLWRRPVKTFLCCHFIISNSSSKKRTLN